MGICLLSSFLLTRYNWISLPNSIKNGPTDGSLLFGHDTGFRISSWWFFWTCLSPEKTESVKALGHQLGHFVHVFKYNETGFLTVWVRYNFARGSISFRTYFNLVLLADWSLGFFLWISPFGRKNAVSLLTTSADHLGSFEIVDAKRERRQFSDQTSWKASQSLAKYDCSLYTESWLRWPFQPSKKFEKNFHFPTMTTPDLKLIAEVMLFSQGFKTAAKLAQQILKFCNFCKKNWLIVNDEKLADENEKKRTQNTILGLTPWNLCWSQLVTWDVVTSRRSGSIEKKQY